MLGDVPATRTHRSWAITNHRAPPAHIAVWTKRLFRRRTGGLLVTWRDKGRAGTCPNPLFKLAPGEGFEPPAKRLTAGWWCETRQDIAGHFSRMHLKVIEYRRFSRDTVGHGRTSRDTMVCCPDVAP